MSVSVDGNPDILCNKYVISMPGGRGKTNGEKEIMGKNCPILKI